MEVGFGQRTYELEHLLKQEHAFLPLCELARPACVLERTNALGALEKAPEKGPAESEEHVPLPHSDKSRCKKVCGDSLLCDDKGPGGNFADGKKEIYDAP